MRHRRRGWRRIQFSTKVKTLRKNYTEMRWIKESSSPISLKFDRNRRVRGLNEKKILISSKAAKVKMPERQTKLTASCYFLMKEFKKKKNKHTSLCASYICEDINPWKKWIHSSVPFFSKEFFSIFNLFPNFYHFGSLSPLFFASFLPFAIPYNTFLLPDCRNISQLNVVDVLASGEEDLSSRNWWNPKTLLKRELILYFKY